MEKHILIIDDDRDELEIFREALQGIPAMYNCSYAQSPEEALNLLADASPDYIFIDYNMPRTNGIECLIAIKKLEQLRDTPLIIYSNSISEETRRNAYHLGAANCIVKPPTINILTAMLKDILV
ncbi:response regulator [Chitinophaga sedimenti]|uniref:response regulator n=1 Tax=Chitinophaga sedimenti TaxID=2033606 RepID=UPI0020038368|nr:response regulator [Chitinophaga sedimenti]MCK7556625.1 response regulator [Chitinophaga sedimenti]